MTSYSPEGALIKTQKNKEHLSSEAGIIRAMEQGIILEAPVAICDHELNLHLVLPCGIRGIIPKDEAVFSQTGERTKDIAILTRVGKTVCFKVTEVKNTAGIKTAYLSRRKAQEECYKNYASKLIPGDVISGSITHIESFGAFVDIGCGIISLLAIDAISVSRINHPSDRLSVGDSIFAVIRGHDELGRINLSMRELLGTWSENAEMFCEGETVSGIVRGVESYGIFVELTPNLAGLAEYKENVRSGQRTAVYIKSIIAEKMKIKLILIDTQDAPSEKIPIEYYINTQEIKHIERWTYSPEASNRLVETIFN